MDAIRSSRKRNHRSSSLSGTFTRSRSQLFLHRNRSGRRQEEPYSDLLRFRGSLKDTVQGNDLCKKAKRDDGDLSHPLAKDLRARRVYSPQSSAGASSDLIEDEVPKDIAVDSDCADRKIAYLGFGSASNVENSALYVDIVIEANESPDLGISCKAMDFERCEVKNGGVCSEKIDEMDEELVLTTPPDAKLCGDSNVDGDKGKNEEEFRVVDAPFAGNTEENSGEGKDSQRNDSVLKNRSMLRPRLPGKLFKAPGSVNYRRLFPFLMDIMGDDSGTPKLGHCQKDEKGMDGHEFQLPSSSNGLTSSHNLLESSMQLDMKEVTSECLSTPSVDDNRLSESKADPTADFHGVKDVENALQNDDFKQHSIHKNILDDSQATNHGVCTSEQFGLLNEECIQTTPPDAEITDKLAVNEDQSENMSQDMYDVKPMDLTKSTQENAGAGLCLKADKRKDYSKSVLRPDLHRKLFKTPGSFSYRRLLPFLMDLTKDDSGTTEFGRQTHHQKGEADMHDTVECNALENKTTANPDNESSHGNLPKLTSSQDLPELPMQLDAKEVVHECLSAPSVNERIEKAVISSKDECLSDSTFDPCSVMVDVHPAEIVANVVHNDGFKQVQNKISTQHYSESSPKDQNMLHINDDVSNLTFEHDSSKENGFTIDYDEREQSVNLEKCESVSSYPPEGQSLSQLDPNMLDAEENETSSHAISKSDDAVVLNHVSVSNEEPRSTSEKVISDKSDMAGLGGDKSESFLKGTVSGSRMPLKGSNNQNASCAGEIENGSESKTKLVLNRCPRIKLLKLAGSFNYKRLLPIFLNTVKYNSCASADDHNPKLQKFLDQTPLLPISDSNMRVTPMSDTNGRVPVEHCTGNSGTQQQAGLHACDLNNDSSSSRSQIPEFHSSHDSCKVIQLQDEQAVLNGLCKLENSTDPPISVHRIDLPSAPLEPKINVEEAKFALSEPSVYSEIKGNSSFPTSYNEEKPPETHGCCQSLSQPKVLEQLRVPAVGFRKGILKRNPRGCRGLCTCLNCVSFRLHAERAFEFSRNQFLDTEEVIQDLRKELSHLRNTLERSTDSVSNKPVFDGSQVKEACRKAFATEQLAKERLSQMNDDLNIHCRIPGLQRPKVRFADHVEESHSTEHINA